MWWLRRGGEVMVGGGEVGRCCAVTAAMGQAKGDRRARVWGFGEKMKRAVKGRRRRTTVREKEGWIS